MSCQALWLSILWAKWAASTTLSLTLNCSSSCEHSSSCLKSSPHFTITDSSPEKLESRNHFSNTESPTQYQDSFYLVFISYYMQALAYTCTVCALHPTISPPFSKMYQQSRVGVALSPGLSPPPLLDCTFDL